VCVPHKYVDDFPQSNKEKSTHQAPSNSRWLRPCGVCVTLVEKVFRLVIDVHAQPPRALFLLLLQSAGRGWRCFISHNASLATSTQYKTTSPSCSAGRLIAPSPPSPAHVGYVILFYDLFIVLGQQTTLLIRSAARGSLQAGGSLSAPYRNQTPIGPPSSTSIHMPPTPPPPLPRRAFFLETEAVVSTMLQAVLRLRNKRISWDMFSGTFRSVLQGGSTAFTYSGPAPYTRQANICSSLRFCPVILPRCSQSTPGVSHNIFRADFWWI